jgi:hypothetical protein
MRMHKFHETTLTGRARARPGWFGKQVLQVEVRTLSFSACPPMPGSDPQAWRERMRRQGTVSYAWRDATWEDLTEPERLTLVPRQGIEPSVAWPRA